MTREEIINGLKFTVGMFLFDPSTGENIEPRNDMDKTTIDACRGAIELLEQEPCEDAVNRQALYEWLDGWKEKNKYYHPHTKNEIIPICEVIDIIQSLPPVTPQPKWIACSERLPENDEVVLGVNSSNDLFKAYTWNDCGEIKWYANGCFDVPVIAWMPLPEPYKEDEEK